MQLQTPNRDELSQKTFNCCPKNTFCATTLRHSSKTCSICSSRVLVAKHNEHVPQYVYVYISRHLCRRNQLTLPQKLMLRTEYLLYGRSGKIISITLKQNCLRYYRLHRSFAKTWFEHKSHKMAFAIARTVIPALFFQMQRMDDVDQAKRYNVASLLLLYISTFL